LGRTRGKGFEQESGSLINPSTGDADRIRRGKAPLPLPLLEGLMSPEGRHTSKKESPQRREKRGVGIGQVGIQKIFLGVTSAKRYVLTGQCGDEIRKLSIKKTGGDLTHPRDE